MIKVDGLKAINKKLKSIDRDLAPELISQLTQDAFKNIKKRAEKHYDTGTMEDNIFRKISKSSLTGIVGIEDNGMMVDVKGSKVNYATFVLYGSKQHIIKPNEKKSLRFSTVQGFVFSKLVHHPGYKGDNFLKDGLQDTFDNIDKIIARLKDD